MQAAQLIHAAGESSPGGLSPGTYAVALHVEDELALRDVSLDLLEAGVPHVLVVEDDAPYCGQAMAIGVEPCERGRVRSILRHLRLVK